MPFNRPARPVLTRLLTAGAAATALSFGVPAWAQDLPAPLEAALSAAEARADLRFSYTMTFATPGTAPVKARYDARTKSWDILEGDPSALPSDAQKRFENVQESEAVPGGLLYADFREHIEDVTLVEETGDAYVYSFRPSQVDEDDMTGEADAAVRTRLVVDRADGRLARYEVVGLKPFKPNPAAKMQEFTVVQEFTRLGEDGPAVLTRLQSRQKGEQFFRKVDTDFVVTFTDHEPVS